MLGDVTGKGIAAAGLTALTRHSARAAALLGLSPAQILELLNRLLLAQPGLSLVTAVVVSVEHANVTVASAGYPLPLRHRPGEPPRELGVAGVLLGFDADGFWPERSDELTPGESLLLYTDGVTDTRRGRERFGQRRLRGALREAPGEPEALLARLDGELRRFERGRVRDDVALLAATLLGAWETFTTGPLVAVESRDEEPRLLAAG